MKIAITLVLLYLVSCGITATAPVAPVPLPGAIVNGIQAATLTEVCIARVMQAGLFKLPQLVNTPKQVGFSKMSTQMTSGNTYIFDYTGTDFRARVVGRCSFADNSAIIDEASYTKLVRKA